MTISIALIGDFNQEVIAHQAIPLAINLAAGELGVDARYEWIDTDKILIEDLVKFDGVWCVPASPYKDMARALSAIQYARENDVPFLGTCGGYQHAALEFARNVLGFAEADNAEVNPDCEMPLISGLTCKLVEKSDGITIEPDTRAGSIYGKSFIQEEYHCSFGVNPEYLSIFEHSGMVFSGKDDLNDPRVLEIASQRFFMGTAFQPERSAFKNITHPVIVALLNAAHEAKA